MEQGKKSLIFSILGVLLIAGISFGYLFYQQARLTQPSQETQKLVMATTIFPLYDILRNLTGDKLEVKLILPPGASPHTFELTPAQIKNLQKTQIIFAVGHGLDNWVNQVTQNISSAQVFLVDQNIDFIHEGGGVNPHYFLSVKNAKIIAQNITQKLTEIDPENQNFYQENLRVYLQTLESLDSNLTSDLRLLTSRKIATFHNAWGYLARDYNLEVVATFEPSPGKEPSPQELKDFEDKIQENHLRVIFSEPQISTDLLSPIAKDLNVQIKVLDPIGGIENRDSFIKLMRYNAQMILESLK